MTRFRSTSSRRRILKRVAEVAITKAPEPARFRPNIVIDSIGLDAFAENAWDGPLISVGKDLRLRVAFPTPQAPCPRWLTARLRPIQG